MACWWFAVSSFVAAIGMCLMLPPSPNVATVSELDAFYNGLGGKMDEILGQWFESAELQVLASNSHLHNATMVLEFGAGDGAFAEYLLTKHMSPVATYVGLELSAQRARDANRRLENVAHRARVEVNPEGVQLNGVMPRSVDRVMSTFVLDLLSYSDIEQFLEQAHTVLQPGGLLCVSSLSHGSGPVSRTIAAVWNAVHTIRAGWVGGCRPVDLVNALEDGEPRWKVLFVHKGAWLPFESVVAKKA